MGGSALSVPTGRLPAATYHPLADKLGRALSEAFGATVYTIPAYRSKPDFGDLDLIVESEPIMAAGGQEALERWSVAYGHSRECFCETNSTVFSFDYRDQSTDATGFQVDLLLTPRAELDVARSYFSYNDLGNLIGRTAHKMGFSHGHRGLLYPMRDGTHQFQNVVVSQDLDLILPFLGYDPVRFRAGFDDLQDIFNYAASTPYFNKDSFLLENRNHTSRTRDRKRPTYTAFLTWIAEQSGLPAYPWVARPERDGEPDPAVLATLANERAHFLALARQTFPGFGAQVDAALQALTDGRAARQRFSGEVVGALTGLAGNPLGQFMESMRKELIHPQTLAEWLAPQTDAQVAAAVQDHLTGFVPRPYVPKPASQRARRP